jgi:arylsulfatase A-like enzyme
MQLKRGLRDLVISKLTRREFLKISTALSLGITAPKFLSSQVRNTPSTNQQNILIVVFDAWSAKNISLYGYARQTTPNLDRLTNKAIVYHNHYAGGHFTTPGTTTLLTGTQSWSHRAFTFYPTLDKDLLQKNIFQAFDGHYRFAYSHNPLADHLLKQFITNLDGFESWERHYFEHSPALSLFKNDQDVATVGWNRAMQTQDDGYAYSLFLARLYEYRKGNKLAAYEDHFPRGVPNSEGQSFYMLEQGIDRLFELTQAVSQPFLGYYHFLPPHDPFNTRKDFYNYFQKDGYAPLEKPPHFFENISPDFLKTQRRWYDEFILYVDAEFARLYQQLEQSGILENTWIVLTSDHGEMFERNIWGHSVPVFYQPLINIPLVIFPPGQKEKIDVYNKTSAVDVLPTLLQVAGQELPSWAEGAVLPPFENHTSAQARDISAVQVGEVQKGEIQSASAMCVRDNYKATWLFGYDEIESGDEVIELYDLVADPEELHDLSVEKWGIAAELVGTLRSKMQELEHTYQQES